MTATETPAQFLRRAAEHLRGLANVATPGGWRTHDGYVPHGGYVATVLAGDSNFVKPVAWVPSFSHEPRDLERQAWPDAAYIAAMCPPVALATADTWDAVADDMGDDEVVERGTAGIGVLVMGRLFSPRKTWTAAVNAARVLLGETES